MKKRIALLLSPALALAAGPSPARADNVGTCGSLTVVNGANDCYVVTPPVVGVEPTIDGQIVGLEWTSALPAKTFNNADGDLTASIQFLRTPTKLFFVVSVADDNFNAADSIELYFDPLHNDRNGDSATASENKALRVRRDGTFAIRTGTGSFVAGPLVAGVSAARTGGGAADPDWRAEISVEPGWFGLAQFGPLVGFGAMANSSDGSADTWPGDFDPDTLSTTWGNLKTRYPYRVALSLDFSGSMLAVDVPGPTATNRWKRAVRAAKMFELVARAVGRENHFANEVNANRWAWLCSGDAAANNLIDVAANNKSAVPLGTLTLSDWISADPDGNNCTPIKKGVEKALASATLDERQPLIILLSDGLHNMPSTDTPFSGAVAGLTDTRVHTIAVGADGVADTTLLANLAASAAAGSSRLPSTYVQRDLTDELLDAYITALSTFFEVQWSGVGPSGATFTPGNAIGDKLIFVGVWDDPAAAGSLTVTRTGTGAVTGAETTDTTAGITIEEIATDAALAGGDWTVSGTGASRIFALVDPRVTATPVLERRIRAAGEPMLLQLDVRAGTLPLTGVEASVEIAHPNESLGTFLATIQPNCERGDPVLPGRDGGDPRKMEQLRLGRVPPLALSWAGPTSASAAGPAGGDPIPGRYALAQQYFERCKKRGLERGALPGQPLVDDGSSGDLVAGDGIYSFLFTQTSKEGSYNFRFHARGGATVSPAPVPTPDGGPPEIPTMEFERTSLESIYVGVFPTPSATASSFVTGAVIGDFQIGFGFILPRDGVGNYLGPGFAGAFTTRAVGGVLVGAVLDLGNGVYGQQVKFPRNGRPGVIFEMKEPCFKQGVGPGAPTSTGCGPEECKAACRAGWWKILWPWLALLLAIILLIIIIAFIKRRRP